jgi:hypothetical protein
MTSLLLWFRRNEVPLAMTAPRIFATNAISDGGVVTNSYTISCEMAALTGAIGAAAAFLGTAPSPMECAAIAQPQNSAL